MIYFIWKFILLICLQNMIFIVFHVFIVKIWSNRWMRKSTISTHITAIFNVIKFTWIHFSIMGILTLLIFATRSTEEKFTNFLNKKLIYLCNVRLKFMTISAQISLNAITPVIKLTFFFTIGWWCKMSFSSSSIFLLFYYFLLNSLAPVP